MSSRRFFFLFCKPSIHTAFPPTTSGPALRYAAVCMKGPTETIGRTEIHLHRTSVGKCLRRQLVHEPCISEQGQVYSRMPSLSRRTFQENDVGGVRCRKKAHLVVAIVVVSRKKSNGDVIATQNPHDLQFFFVEKVSSYYEDMKIRSSSNN